MLALSEAVLVIEGTVKQRVNHSFVEHEHRRVRLRTRTRKKIESSLLAPV